jgi:hypothetical protein
MSVFNARNVAAQKSRPLFDVALRQVLLFAHFPDSLAYNHSVAISSSWE